MGFDFEMFFKAIPLFFFIIIAIQLELQKFSI